MTRLWGPLVIAVAMLASSSGLAQDNSGGAPSRTAQPSEPAAPNAPPQATAQGPLPAGDAAGTATASNWMADPVNLAIGAVVIGAVVCLVMCDTGQSSTSSTTTTTPK